MRGSHFIKKFLVLFGAAIAISMVSVSDLYAQQQQSSSQGYLYNIMVNTYGALKQLNKLPDYFNDMGEFIKSWMKPDKSKSTAKIQGTFATFGKTLLQNEQSQKQSQVQLMIDLIMKSSNNAIQPGQTPAATVNQILKQVPNLNDLSYGTLIGVPPAPKAMTKESPSNYIKNVSGITLTHVIPSIHWQGPANDQDKYQNYYNTVMAIESYGGYVLSDQLVDALSGNALSSIQTDLITQAASSSWIAEIATEELGKVLRQILMFESQSYIILTELLQTQKQALTAQVMTNALLILSNQNGESLLVSKAEGVQPQP